MALWKACITCWSGYNGQLESGPKYPPSPLTYSTASSSRGLLLSVGHIESAFATCRER